MAWRRWYYRGGIRKKVKCNQSMEMIPVLWKMQRARRPWKTVLLRGRSHKMTRSETEFQGHSCTNYAIYIQSLSILRFSWLWQWQTSSLPWRVEFVKVISLIYWNRDLKCGYWHLQTLGQDGTHTCFRIGCINSCNLLPVSIVLEIVCWRLKLAAFPLMQQVRKDNLKTRPTEISNGFDEETVDNCDYLYPIQIQELRPGSAEMPEGLTAEISLDGNCPGAGMDRAISKTVTEAVRHRY